VLELPAHYVNAALKEGEGVGNGLGMGWEGVGKGLERVWEGVGKGLARGWEGIAIVSTVIVLHFTDIVVPSIKGLFYAYISGCGNRIRNRIESKPEPGREIPDSRFERIL